MQPRGILKGLGAAVSLMMVLSLLPGYVGAGPQEARDPVLSQDVAAQQLQQAPANVFNTLRTYGRRNEGPGDLVADDPVTQRSPEDPPYTDEVSIFDPQGPQAPRKDFITWNPIWMYEAQTFDELQAGGLYQRLNTGGVNASEKVWFRMWYEPGHWDKDLNADQVYSPTADIVYPAVMQEFTYLLMQGRFLANDPRPTSGPAGATSFVFPVGMRRGDLFAINGSVDTTSANALYGYGLTSFDANFDGVPDIVHVHSEQTLATTLGVLADFDGDGVADPLDTDGAALSGDELAVFTLDARNITVGGSLQFLDHMVRVESVSDTGARLSIWYLGDLQPRNMGLQSINIGQVYLYGTQFPGTLAPNTGVPAGPWFVQVTSVDLPAGTAQVRVGRALGAPFSAMEQAPNSPDIQAGDPWFLKRFYVDGHEYNVVALGTVGNNNFSYITIRTPVPKVPVTINQHSVRLQGYSPEDWLSVMPPYNHEHYILDDVQRIDQFPEFFNHDPPPGPYFYNAPYLGNLIGPVAPILQRNGPFPYYGVGPDSPYWDPREMFLFYVLEDVEPQFVGELREKYGEVPGETNPEEFWYAEQWFTLPWQFTEFVLPDLGGADLTDLYLLTSSFFDRQAMHWLWNMDAVPQAPVTQTMDLGELTRVHFWYDQHEGGKKYKDPSGLRVYGEEDPVYGQEGWGAGDYGVVTDTVSGPIGTALVEEKPYTDPWAPFNPQLPQAPRKDSITMNPAYLNEFRHTGEELVPLYEQIAIESNNAAEKVFPRLWYEPVHLDKILYHTAANGVLTATEVYTFPAVMQEFTYMFLDTADNPSHGQPGSSALAFPVGATATELPVPSKTAPYGLPPHLLPSFGYGLTSFDADFNGAPDIVRVHSEASLSTLVTGIGADFDGDGALDNLDTDGVPLSGDELVVFTVGGLTVGIGDSVQFLDHLVTLENVSPTTGQAQLQIWYTGGGLHALGGGLYSLHPDNVGPATPCYQGDMVIAGRDRVNVRRIPAGGNNLGSVDGPWFVWVADVDTYYKTATLIVGRALGGTHSAIDDGNGNHDLEPGDPWYLKRFFVDGHEYNVVAVRAVPVTPSPYPYEFKYITIRTPVPKETFVNMQDSQVLQGYFIGQVWGVDTSIISVMPPFNFNHTIAPDILALNEWVMNLPGEEFRGEFANPDFYDPDCASVGYADIRAASPVRIRINEEDRDPQFFGELKELKYGISWRLRQFHTLPDRYTDLALPADQLHLLTSSWLSTESWAHYYACGETVTTQDGLAALNPGIPISNSATITGTGYYDPQMEEPTEVPTDTLRVKFWYDPRTAEDIYVNQRTLTGAEYTLNLDQGLNLFSFPILPFDPDITSVLAPIAGQYVRTWTMHCGVGGLTYDPALPPGINNLHQMDGYHGYWIRMNSSATLTVRGWPIPVGTPLYLCSGWNFVSYLPSTVLPVADALNSISGFYQVVNGFDGGGLSYYPDLPPGMNTLQNMERGFGYEIRMTRAGTLVYPAGTLLLAEEVLPNAEPMLEGINPSSEWVTAASYHSTLGGERLPEGTLVQAYDSSGTLAGQCLVREPGRFVMTVYGDDPLTDVDEGAVPGERLTFLVNGQPVYVFGPDAPVWTEKGDLVLVTLSDRGWVFAPVVTRGK
ncbi:MAG: hypothetical protein ACUVXG_10050 [Anaerolineae bacterium]